MLLFVLLTRCAGTQQQQATKAMLVAQTGIVNVATSADQLCSAGMLNQEECAEISVLYEKAKVYYDLSGSALSTAIQMDDEGSWQNYKSIHENFQRIYSDLLAVALKYGIEEVE
jgi:hypothetical protein